MLSLLPGTLALNEETWPAEVGDTVIERIEAVSRYGMGRIMRMEDERWSKKYQIIYHGTNEEEADQKLRGDRESRRQ